MTDLNENAGRPPLLAPEAERSLRASDAIIEISADAIISIDAAQRIIRFNRGAEEIFGYPRAEVLGRSLDSLLPERFRAVHAQHITLFGQGEVAARRMGERRLIAGLRASGEEFPAEASISRVDIADERIYTVVLRDISERQRAEQASRFLAQAGELLAGSLDPNRTLESLARLSVPVLGDGCLIYQRADANSARVTLTSHHDQARSSAMHQLRDLPLSLDTRHPIAPVLKDGQSSLVAIDSEVLQALAPDAAQLKVLRQLDPRSLIAVPIRIRDQIVAALCFLFDGSRHRSHDRDDLELAEELARRASLALDNARLYTEATQAVRARDDVLAVVSHDLGNPLSAIRVSTSVLLRRTPAGDNPERRQLENIRSSVEQMERLINDLLDVKRIEAGLLSLEREARSVHSLMSEVAEAAAGWIDGRPLRLEVEGASQSTILHVDSQRVLQVFSNLVGNAARFAPNAAEIELRSSSRDGEIVFSVSDSGPGIPAEHLQHLFDRFWQARRTGRHGIGLGLAIVKGIVEAHGGRVWAESELGVGTTFYFTLPVQRTSG